jgi:D-alanine-D-alanine ligase
MSMHVGITYDLKDEYLKLGYSSEEVAEFDREDTIAALEASIQRAGHTTTRIGRAQTLMARLAQGESWDLVFNIAEGAHGAARESQVPAILDVVGIPYTFSDPLVLAVCLDKRLAKHVVSERGIPTPKFAVVEQLAAVDDVNLGFPLFAKPIAEGTSRGVTALSRVESHAELVKVCDQLLQQYRQPVIVERYLPGREFTVGIVGTGDEARSLGALEVHLNGHDNDVYSYDNKQLFEGRVEYTVANDPLARAATDVALRAYRTLGCRDGGRVDVRCDETGQPSFIEANPLAGLNPDISDLAILARLQGIPYDTIVNEILRSAAVRVGSPRRS